MLVFYGMIQLVPDKCRLKRRVASFPGAAHISPQCGLNDGSHRGQISSGGAAMGVVKYTERLIIPQNKSLKWGYDHGRKKNDLLNLFAVFLNCFNSP